jgi:hypothetical protein
MLRSGSPRQRAEHYRDHVARLRELAEASAGKVRDKLLDLADQYERLAASLEEVHF